MTTLEAKYGTLSCLSSLKKSFCNFEIKWELKKNKEFEELVNKFIKSKGILNKDVYYITNTIITLEELSKLKYGETLDFGYETSLKRADCKQSNHTYLYSNLKPIAFGLHIHPEQSEILTPLDNDVIIFIKQNNLLKKIIVKVGETYITPANVQHAALSSKPNTIKITWK